MEGPRHGFRWGVLSLLFFSLFAATLAMQCMPPLFSEIAADIPLSKAQMGTVMGVLTLASLFFAPVGGALCDRLGSRWTLGLSADIVALGGAMRYFAGSVTGLIICMFIIGAGISMYPANLPKAVGSWIERKDLAKVDGIWLAGMGIGGALAMSTGAVLLALLLWTGNTLLDIRQKVTTLEVQVQVMQTQLQSGVDDRFRGSDWRREKEILDDRFKRIEAEIDKHRVATERR